MSMENLIADLAAAAELSALLCDAAAGVVALQAKGEVPPAALHWQLSCDGEIRSSGRLQLEAFTPGMMREYTLSYDIPAVCIGTRILLHLTLLHPVDGAQDIACFDIPPAKLLPLPEMVHCITGCRSAVSSSIISAGKLAAVVEGSGIVNMTVNGETLMLRGPRLNLWRAPRDCDREEALPRWLKERFDRIKVVPDHFVSNGNFLECRQLALPFFNDDDEFEFIQQLYPRRDGVIVADMTLVVPGCFADLPRLGISLELPEDLQDITYFGRGPRENYPDNRTTAAPGLFHTTPEKMFVAYDKPQECGNRCDTEFAAFRSADRQLGLLIVPGNVMGFSALPYSVGALDFAASVSSLKAEKRIFVNCDLHQRSALVSPENLPLPGACRIHPGRYRFMLFFKALAPQDDPALTAHSIRAFAGEI